MKILLASHHLCHFGGSETYVYTIAKGLADAGHDVHVYAPFIGSTADRIAALGIPVEDDIHKLQGEGGFDVVHAQHNITAMIVREMLPHVPMLLMVHGVLPQLEQLPSALYGITEIAAVSREVCRHLEQRHPGSSPHLIHNCVDTKWFACKAPIHGELQKVLVLSNHFPEAHLLLLEEACRTLQLDYAMLGMVRSTAWHTEDAINEADLVITLGRGALESMACGRAVMVWMCTAATAS